MNALFSSTSVISIADLPVNIEKVLAKTDLIRIRSPEKIINEHTLYPFFTVFQSDKVRKQAMREMLCGNGRHLTGLIQGTIRMNLRYENMMYCPLCVKSDVDLFAEPYWHRLHRAPGVLVCPDHCVYLETACSNCGYSFKLEPHRYIPIKETCDCGNSLWNTYRTVEQNSLKGKRLLEYAELVEELLAVRIPFEPDEIKERYHSRLQKMGLETGHGNVRTIKLAEAIREYFGTEFLQCLNSSLDCPTKQYWFLPILHEKNNWSPKPVHNLLLIQFLFGSIAAFMDSHTEFLPFGSDDFPCLNKASPHYGARTSRLVCVKTQKRTQKPMGVFSCPDCQFVYLRIGPDQRESDLYRFTRILRYGPVWQQTVTNLLHNGMSYNQIAHQLGVSQPTISAQAKAIKAGNFTHPVLAWEKEQFEVIRERCRNCILAVVQALGNSATRAGIEKQCKQEYAWMLEWDKSWLDANLPKPLPRIDNLKRIK
ncbi:MAG: Tn7-like transposition protein [Firmicutes bacterium]|nr:Tn7-like transposition protein [Bacillota bacterium]